MLADDVHFRFYVLSSFSKKRHLVTVLIGRNRIIKGPTLSALWWLSLASSQAFTHQVARSGRLYSILSLTRRPKPKVVVGHLLAAVAS